MITAKIKKAIQATEEHSEKIFSLIYIFWLTISILIPIILVIYYGITSYKNNHISFDLNNFLLITNSIYIKIFYRSIKLAVLSTLTCLLIGYPIAYIIYDKTSKLNSNSIFLFLIPMWLNIILRTYAWLILLDKNGLVNFIAKKIKLGELNLLYRSETIILGTSYDLLPFMIFPIYNSLKKINKSIIEAAYDLGANKFIVFKKIIFPLSSPGVTTGIIMVFMPSLTTFMIPDILGAGKFMFIGNLIEMQFLKTYNWHFGAALSIILLLIIIFLSICFYYTLKLRSHIKK
jgi:spermidine/putrescine transport system permease protein